MASITSTIRRFSLKFPITWLAGWHLAVAGCMLGVLVLLGIFSPLMDGVGISARRELGAMWVFASMFGAVALVARMHTLSRDTAFTTGQRIRLFASASGMLLLFGTQPAALVVAEKVVFGQTGFVNWRIATQTLATYVGFGMSLGIMLVAASIFAHLSGRSRGILNSSIFMAVAGTAVTAFMSGVVIHDSWLGIVSFALVLLVTWGVALFGDSRTELGFITLSRADLALFSVFPLYMATTILLLYFVDELRPSGVSNREGLAFASLCGAAALCTGYVALIRRQDSVRALWGNE